MSALNLAALKAGLRAGLDQGWAAFRQAHPAHEVYGLGLYTSELAEYVGLTIFSEQGLDEVAARYAAQTGGAPATERRALRWSPCDSPFHMWRPALFGPAQAALDAAGDPYEQAHGGWSDAALESFVGALRAFREGGALAERSVLLCVWMGDQSDDDRLRYAAQLNPPPLLERLEAELEAP